MKTHNCFYPDKHTLLNGRILVKMPQVENKTKGGIIINDPEIEARKTIKGVLIAYNEFAFADRRLQPDGSYSYIEWKDKPEIGDIVYFTLYAGMPLFTEDGEQYRNMLSEELTGYEKINNKKEI